MRARVLVLCVVLLVATALPAAAVPDPPVYVPPVPGPVTEPFDPPATRYGPGHRGISYDPGAGTVVHAAADGVVVFAGSVAGSLHVTIRHPDGIRTTYSYLGTIGVVVGQHVRQGDEVGTAGDRFQLGARRGDDYFDPSALFGSGPPTSHLVPFDDPPADGPAGERSAVRQLLGGLVGGAADWLRDTGHQLGTLGRTLGHYGGRFTPGWGALVNGLTLLEAWQAARRRADRPCTTAESPLPAPPGDRRIALQVAGVGSNSHDATIEHLDTAALGYDPPDVVRFSYAGGRTPDPTDAFTTVPTHGYEALDTQDDLRVAGRRLADVVEQLAAEAAGAPIDLLAHSQGGLVVRLALIELERRHGRGWLAHLGLVVTFASPHGGTDLATGLYALSTTSSGDALLDAYQAATDLDLRDDGTSLAQLSEASDVVAELEQHPIPPEVHALAIAVRGDLLVPAPRAKAPGATNVTLPLTGRDAHSAVVGSPAAQREVALALAGLPPGCESFRDALLDVVWGEGISYGEDIAGAAGWASGWWLDLHNR